ncbi:hypothetical protein ACFE04_017905 [Oxalis oulophora]
MVRLLYWLVLVAAMERWWCVIGGGQNVTYDGRSLIVNGERKLLFSGSIHYPRSTPEMWPWLIAKAKAGGIDVIETYVFWNLHEPQPGEYDFSGRKDLVKFIKQVQSHGLYVCLRIGPFIEAEWNYGGFPFWLHDIPDIVYRSDNEPFKFYMQNFTTKIVNLMKSENLYAPQGGPIILSQIENEYQHLEQAFHEKGPSYVKWAAKMAVGLISQPKYGHLRDLHVTIKNCSTTLLQGVASNFSLGSLQQAYVFEEKSEDKCAAFLVNNNTKSDATVQFRNMTFVLPPKSISILPDCKNEVFNSAKVHFSPTKRGNKIIQKFNGEGKWEEFRDSIANSTSSSFTSNSLLEHMNVTKDQSDYLWYTSSFEAISSCIEPMLHINSSAHVAHVFVNNNYSGAAHGNRSSKTFAMDIPISLLQGTNNISILSVMVGLPDSGAYLERRRAGPTTVKIKCTCGDSYDLSNSTWGYQVGLLGEKLRVYEEESSNITKWNKLNNTSHYPLTWYKRYFDEPSGNEPVVLNLSWMGKGEAWVNGQSIGRYWVSFHTPKGRSSQQLYHIPRSFLKKTGNLLVLLEELTGNPLQTSIDTIWVSNVEENHIYHLSQ